MKPRWKAVLGLFGMAALLYFLAVSMRSTSEDVSLSPAPPLSLPDLQGRTVSLSEFKGKVVLLDFWATWCDPCIEELPDLKRLHATYKDRGFTMVGVSLDVLGAKAVRPFVSENKVPYPVLLSGGEPPEGYRLPGLPTAFLIDREGRIARRYIGPKLYEEVARDVEELLGS